MIHALQTKFQKHHKIIFFVMLAIIIVAFVFTIGAAPGIGGETQTARQEFFGHNLASPREMTEIAEAAQLSLRIEYGQTQIDQRQFENYVFERLTLLGLADRLGIPGPTDEQFPTYITSLRGFQNAQGTFDPDIYNDFIDEIDANPTMSEDDVGLVLEDNFRIAQVREILGGPGYILPTEVRLQLERNQTVWSVDLAKFDIGGFEADVQPTDEQLQQFYEENSFRYERAPRTDFAYVVFESANYVDQVPAPKEEELKAYFERNRNQFTPPAPAENAENQTETPEVTLDDVRDQVTQSVRMASASRLASRAASDFAYALFENKARQGTDEFQNLINSFNAELKEAPPASANEFPAELGFPRAVQQEVFRLNEDRHFSDPLALRNDYIVLVFQETLPAYVPPLEEVRDQVAADFINEEERRLLAERAEEIRASIVEKVKNGQPFAEAAQAEGLEVTSADSFTRMTAPSEVPPAVSARLTEFKQGEVSTMIPVQDAGYFVHIRDRQVPEIDPESDEFASTAENLKSLSSMASQNYVLQEVMEREIGNVSHEGHAH